MNGTNKNKNLSFKRKKETIVSRSKLIEAIAVQYGFNPEGGTKNYNFSTKKLHKTSNPRVSPYQLILHNQRYYLMARHEGFETMNFYRLDRITDMQIVNKLLKNIREIEGYKSGIDYKKISSGLPYMFTDKLEYIELLTDESVLDQVIDWFGTEVKIESEGDKYKVSLLASPAAMEYWALQYVKSVQILAPKALREQIKETLKNGVSLYEEE